MLLQPQHLVETGPRVPPGTGVRLTAPTASVTHLEQLLKKHGFPVVGVDPVPPGASLASEEYALDINASAPDEASATITVRHGDRALRHVVRTLSALAGGTAADGLPAVVVRDWPAVATRGIIEGYYGPPWSHATRLAQLDFVHEVGMNAYFLSPKDDPYLREQWRDSYPADRIDRLAELSGRAADLDIDLIFAVSPGLDIVASDPADLRALVEKFRAAYDAGIRHFVVPFDDIDSEAVRGQDQVVFGSDLSPAAALQSSVANHIREAVAGWPDCGPVQLVPTDYFQGGKNDYRDRLRELLHPDVQVHWTGVGICAPVVTAEQVRATRAEYGHDIVLWDNYPVNDYLKRSLVLGPYCGRDSDAAVELTSVLANAMPQAIASRIGFAAVAAWSWNPAGLDAEASWHAAVRTVGGDKWPALMVLAELCRSSPMAGRTAPVLAPLDDLHAAVEAGDEAGIQRAASLVTALADRMQWAAAELREGGLRDLATEVGGWVDAMDNDADSLRAAADAAASGRPLTLDGVRGAHELAVGLLRPALAELAARLEENYGGRDD